MLCLYVLTIKLDMYTSVSDYIIYLKNIKMWMQRSLERFGVFNFLINCVICNRYYSVYVPFHDTRCPPSLTTNCLDRIARHFQVRTGDLQIEKEVHVVEGLNKVMNSFEKTNFLVVLTNFRGASFSELRYPVVLRNVQLAWVWSSPSISWEWELTGAIYVQEETLQRSINLTDAYQNQFTLVSKYWSISEFCPALNIVRFGANARPWSNLVSISLLPHTRLQRMLRTVYHPGYTFRKSHTYNVLPSLISQIKIFVVNSVHTSNVWKLKEFIMSHARTLSYEHTGMMHQLIYVVNSIFTSPDFPRVEKAILLQNLVTVKLCQRQGQASVNFVAKHSMWNSIANLTELSTTTVLTCHETPNLNNLLFSISTSFTNEVKINLEGKLHVCNNAKKLEKSNAPSGVDLVADGYSNVLLSVMGNFSYWANERKLCENGILFSGEKVEETKLLIALEIRHTLVHSKASATLYPAVVTSVYNDLKFVTSGYRGSEQISFVALLDAFDKYVWFLLVAYACSLIIAFRKLLSTAQNFTISESVWVPVKILLEQGNPFPEILMNNLRYKSVAGVLLLMGIVLSNAYKNTNVYKMIIPRNPVPYRYLRELISDNITIQTRSLHGFYSIYHGSWIDRNLEFQVARSDQHYLTYTLPLEFNGKNISGLFGRTSEVFDLRDVARNARILNLDKNFNLLFSVSSLMPFTETYFRDVVKGIDSNVSKQEFPQVYINQFYQMELKSLSHFLKHKKGAVLLPSYLAFKFMKNLEKEGQANIYQGVETFYEGSIAVVLQGLIPQYLVQRAKSAGRCGLWSRWESLFRKRFSWNGERKSEPLKTPDMDGNVVIIFILLFSGLGVAFVCFGAESVFTSCICLSGCKNNLH